MLRLDHLMYVTSDLDACARRIRFELGLGSYPGGEHPGLGTSNRVVPVGDGQYVELIAVRDESVASSNAVGKRVLDWAEGLHAWCLATDDVDAVAARLGLQPVAMNRILPDGSELSWRLAGVERSMADPSLPFFIEWEIDDHLHPSRQPADHTVEPSGIAWLEVGGDPERVARWVDGAELPVRVIAREPGPIAVGIATPDGEVVLR